MEQDQQVHAGVDEAARRDGNPRRCMRTVLGSTLLFGGLAAWIASDALYKALPKSSVGAIVVWVAVWQSLGVAAMAMLLISVWMAISEQMRRVGMQLFWRIHSLPELKHLARAERVRAYRACRFKNLREWQTWSALVAIILATAVGWCFTFTLGIEPHAFILTGLLGGIAGGVIGSVLMHRTRHHLRDCLERSQSCINGDAASREQPQGPPSSDQLR